MKVNRLKVAVYLSLALVLASFITVQAGQGLAVAETCQQPEAHNRVTQQALACNAELTTKQAERIRTLSSEFRTARLAVKELPDGYAVQLPGNQSMLNDVGEYLTLLGSCCPFFDAIVRSEREDGPVWLTLGGREGVKALAKMELRIGSAAESLEPAKARSEKSPSPLACKDDALTDFQKQRLVSLLTRFRNSKLEVAELNDGYAVRLPRNETMIRDVTEYMSIVRLCSPYFETTLQAGCDGGDIWLRISGREGVKGLAKAEFRI